MDNARQQAQRSTDIDNPTIKVYQFDNGALHLCCHRGQGVVSALSSSNGTHHHQPHKLQLHNIIQDTMQREHITNHSNTANMAASERKTIKAKPFRLLHLPPELWGTIDKLAVDDYYQLWSKIAKYAIDISPRTFWSTIASRSPDAIVSPPLAKVCRSLRQEILPYYYSTRVEIHNIHLDSRKEVVNIGKWVTTVDGEYRRHIRGVTAMFCGEDNKDLVKFQ
ncbi:hypothetical protein DOTSEDRAFT_27779 [Dothistroma septosporum NZE10]|uniref:F-box domain-containing protein n=1 Tax=Dothistroma septosporum (strain NZE10 / CBS 128990) TaxID=675120 RepID=N1PE23_DOTSN|nr:hypothetical protein DOTSEDRAFT_27779 [Dothistroma septosporum NZE10]